MRAVTVTGLRVASVALLFWLILQGPDHLLATVLDVRLWATVGVASGLLTLPLLWLAGVGLVPAWTMPAVAGEVSLPRVSLYHLCCSVLGAWLWTQPTRILVAEVHELRGLGRVAGGVVPPDVVSVVLGLLAAELLFLVLALVAFVSTAPFGTSVDLASVDAAELLRPGVAGIGSYLVAAFLVSVLLLLVGGG